MMLQIPGVLTKAEVAVLRDRIDVAGWIDGARTAGPQAALAKANLQLPQTDPAALEAGGAIARALLANPLFMAAALPHTVLPPLFNRYGGAQHFADHVDNAVRVHPLTHAPIRADLSATLFLTEPDDYDGGELIIDDTYGAHAVKLAAGDLILYPASSLHRVTPVTRGERVSSFFWIQSLVREDARRALLFDMDCAIQTLGQQVGLDAPAVVSLTGGYHNLLRMWVDT